MTARPLDWGLWPAVLGAVLLLTVSGVTTAVLDGPPLAGGASRTGSSQGGVTPALAPTVGPALRLDQPGGGSTPPSLVGYEPGYPSSVDPEVDYDLAGQGVIENVYETLITNDGNSSGAFAPVVATCVPGTAPCVQDYGSSLVVNGSGPLAGQPVFWTFVLDPAAQFYDPTTGGTWGVYPSDVMFSIARDLLFADPAAVTPGWVVAQALLPNGSSSWDGGLHYPYNNTPSEVLGSMLVNDSRFCPESSPRVFAGHGCVTFVADGSGSAWPFFLQILGFPTGTSIVPCGWFTAHSAGIPGWAGTSAPSGDGSCRLPDGGTTTNSSAWTTYLTGLSPTAWDSLQSKVGTTSDPQPGVQWSMAGSGPYSELYVNGTSGYGLRANPAYAEPSGCSGAGGLTIYSASPCDPSPGSYAPSVTVLWEPSDNLSAGLSAMQNGTAQYAAVAENDTAAWVALDNHAQAKLLEIPGVTIFGLNFNFAWNPSTFGELGTDSNPSIPSDFFAGMAVRGLLSEAYPYAAVESSVWTVDGVPFSTNSGGPIPRGMPPYSAAIYAPSGNVTFPNGTPATNSTVVGGAAWWYAVGTNSSSPYYDPELENCSGDVPCDFPVFGIIGDAPLDAAIFQFALSVSAITNGAVNPFLFNLTYPEMISALGQAALTSYAIGWAPDYLDPTDYLYPYVEPSGPYAAADALNATLSQPQYDQTGSCGHSALTFADLIFWAEHGPLTSACEGVAYQVAVAASSVAAHQAGGTGRATSYDLISQVLNELALYTWVGQPNEVVGVAPNINVSSVNTNPGYGGDGVQPWFELRDVPASSPAPAVTTAVGSAPGTPLYDRLNGEIYVPDTGGSTVSVLSSVTGRLLTNISVGAAPDTPVLDPENGEVFVANFGSGNVSVINGSTNVVVANITVGTGPWSPVLVPTDGGELFVANNGSANVSLIDPSRDLVDTSLPVGLEPGTPAFDPANGYLYVPNFGSSNVTVIDTSTWKVVTSIPTGAGPEPPVYDPSTGDLYVPDAGQNAVTVIAGATDLVIATIPVGTQPFRPVGDAPIRLFSRTTAPREPPLYDPANGNVYVSNLGSANVSVISGASISVVGTVPVGTDPQPGVYDPTDQHIYVANAGSDNVSVVSGATGTVLTSIEVGVAPAPPVFDNASSTLFLPSSGSDYVSTVESSFYVSFHETGLPSGAAWHVVAGPSVGTTGALFHRTTVPVASENGTVAYTVVGPAGYRVTGGLAPSGELTVAGADLDKTVVFAPGSTTTVTFRESGLPKGVTWCATLGWTTCAASPSVTFANFTPASYAFSVAPVRGFDLTFPPGKSHYVVDPMPVVNVTGHAVTVKAKFSESTYALTFHESGLPAGKGWSVRVVYAFYGKTVVKQGHSKTASITIDVPNGSVAYTVASVKGFAAVPHGSLAVAGSAVSVSVTFVPLAAPVGHDAPAPSSAAAVRRSAAAPTRLRE